MSEAEKSNSSVVHQVPLEKVVSQARGKGQNMSQAPPGGNLALGKWHLLLHHLRAPRGLG